MKKVLSVLLAAAMVMGMSVSAFAADFEYSPVPSTATKEYTITGKESVNFGKVHHHDPLDNYIGIYNNAENIDLNEGDILYFEVAHGTTGNYQWMDAIPSNWILKINNSEYVNEEGCKFVLGADNHVYIKITLATDFDAKDVARENVGEAAEFWFYVVDKNTKKESGTVGVHYLLDTYPVEILDAADIADVVKVEEDVLYTLGVDAKGKAINSAMVVFDFDGVLVTVKMWKGEKYMITSKVNAVWSKELSKQYDTDIEVLSFESDLDVREVLFEASKDNKQVVAVVDGELVAVDSEFVTKYEVIDGVELARGYIADVDANEGAYALIPADLELIEVEEEATEEETKENPSTGANDFVGAAVALAVVSVAAAGALALKK